MNENKIDNNYKNQNINLVFMGTPEFACPILEVLIKEGYNIKAVVTQPDKKLGRKMLLTQSPIKQKVIEFGLKIIQPEKIKKNIELYEELKNFNLDLIVVVAYGKILPIEILNLPKFGCLNIHASILPKYRGPSPIHNAILNGDTTTGVTLMKIDEKMDTGDILAISKIKIEQNDTLLTLEKKLSQIGSDLIKNKLPDFLQHKIKAQKQDNSKVTYTKIITKQDGLINWHESAQNIFNKFKAFIEWPSVFTYFNNTKIKLTEIFLPNKNFVNLLNTKFTKNDIGKIIIQNSRFFVLCGDYKFIEVIKIQPENKNSMYIKDYIHGIKKNTLQKFTNTNEIII